MHSLYRLDNVWGFIAPLLKFLTLPPNAQRRSELVKVLPFEQRAPGTTLLLASPPPLPPAHPKSRLLNPTFYLYRILSALTGCRSIHNISLTKTNGTMIQQWFNSVELISEVLFWLRSVSMSLFNSNSTAWQCV